MVEDVELRAFLATLWRYYSKHARSALPWRQPEPSGVFDPYKILVSELMLQQTQVSRVIPKFGAFIDRFPSVETLATAELGDVLRQWQGLGYNRRAKYLWLASQHISTQGWPEDLTALPGVGPNTAGAIRAYAFNEPAIFIETNIRTVYIHHFASDQQNVPDSFIQELLTRTLRIVTGQGKRAAGQNMNHFDRAMRKNAVLSHEPRDFYWALMDYGTHLKTRVRNLSQSKHYKRQPAFQGSRRQIRGRIIRELSRRPLSLSALQANNSDDRLGDVLLELEHEGLIIKRGGTYRLSS